MARSALTVQSLTINGVAPSLVAANADGHSIENFGETFIEVNNGSGSPITVTVQTAGTIKGVAIADITINVPAGETRLIRLPHPSITNYPTGAYVDFSAVTSVTVTAYRLE